MNATYPAFALALAALVWSASAWDLRFRRIPNWLVLAGLFGGFALQISALQLAGIVSAASGLLVGMAIMLPGYLAGFTGAGDVKLMGAAGSFLGASGALFAGLASLLAGFAVALVFLVLSLFSTRTRSPWRRYGLMAKTLMVSGQPIYIRPGEAELMATKFPFAISIAIGTSTFLVWQSSLIG